MGFTICFIYSNTLYITEYVKTLYYLTCRILLSFHLKRGYLERFGRILGSPFTVPLHRRTWASVPEHFPPQKSHCSLIRKVEWFTLLLNLPIKNPSKRPRASSQRKLQSHGFQTFKMCSKIYTCQPEIVLLIASFWLDVIRNKWLNNNRLKQTRCLFLISYSLTTSNQKEETSADAFWLASKILATHFDRSKIVGF